MVIKTKKLRIMNKKLFLLMTGVVLASITFTAMTSCEDDHYTVDPVLSGKGTMWENIQQTPELSEFASILSKVYYSTSETSVTTQTYADLLNHDQTFTLWAPKNGTFDYAKWNAMLESGDREQIYKVENELIRSCMTRYSHVLTGSKVEDITFFNSKKGTFDCGSRTINDVNIVEANLGTTNGVVHITDGAVAYLPNIYEYINSNENLTRFSAFLKKYEDMEFDETASTQGPTVDGNITWVDSVSHLTNTYFYPTYLGAYINREDSSYVMVLPNDQLWDAQYDKMKSYFNYRTNYSQNVITVNPVDLTTSTETLTTTYSEEELDSIVDFRTNDAIARNLCFNHNWQYGHNYVDMATEGVCDSIMATSGVVFYDPYSAQLFDHVEPVKLSNGYGYLVDNFNYRLEDTWLEEKEYEAERFFESYDYANVNRTRVYVDNPYSYVEGFEGEPTDTVVELTAITLSPTRSTANTSVKIALNNTYSCKYDVIAVMVYNVNKAKPYHFRAYLNYHNTGNKATQERTQLTPPEGTMADGKNFVSRKPYVDEKGMLQFCDSMLLAKDFELPVSYYGVRDAYLTLEIQSYMTSSQRNLYTNELIIDKIVLVPKENETE